MSLKVVKFDTKMYFQIFGENLGWGGDKPWSKNGDKCRMGGIGKILPDGGNPQSPQEKKHWGKWSHGKQDLFLPQIGCQKINDSCTKF